MCCSLAVHHGNPVTRARPPLGADPGFLGGLPRGARVSLQLSDRCRPYSQELRERLWEKLFENVPTPNRPAAAMAPMLLENSINQIKMDGCYRHTK